MTDPRTFVPTNKFDQEAVRRAIDAGWPAVQPVVRELLGWCYDGNWPVARDLSRFLGGLGVLVADEVREVLRGTDGTAKYFLLYSVVGAMPDEGFAALEDDVRRLATSPTVDDVREEADEAARGVLDRRHG